MDLTREEQRLRDARTGSAVAASGGRTSASASGARSARTTATTATRGRTSATTRPARGPTAGARTAWPGISDEHQRLCFALALWNEQDPILKERLFGLTNTEGNHGEDVKEYYFYVDNLPTHCLPALAVQVPAGGRTRTPTSSPRTAPRSRFEMEYELLDTGVFDDDRYFDVEVDVRQGRAATTSLCRITVHNRGPEDAPIHLLPTLWFRNTWSFPPHTDRADARAASTGRSRSSGPSTTSSATWHLHAGRRRRAAVLRQRVQRRPAVGRRRTRRRTRRTASPTTSLHGTPTVNPAGEGTKVAAHVRLVVPAGGSAATWLRLTTDGAGRAGRPVRRRRRRRRRPARRGRRVLRRDHAARRSADDAAAVMRQALAGMLWSKQSLLLRRRHVAAASTEAHPLRHPQRRGTRNEAWFHMVNHDVISMPDTWEYPWYAAWDLAFHCHPAGDGRPRLRQVAARPDAVAGLPPPDRPDPRLRVELRRRQPAGARLRHAVHAQRRRAHGRRSTCRSCASRSHACCSTSRGGSTARTRPARTCSRAASSASTTSACSTAARRCRPAGGSSRPTARRGWRCSARTCSSWRWRSPSDDPDYEDFVLKFVEHFFWIAAAVDPIGDHPDEMWDDEDGFFYDVLRLPDGTRRAAQGALARRPAAAVRHDGHRGRACSSATPSWRARVRSYLERNHDLLANIADPLVPGRQRPPPAVARQRGQAAPHPRRGCSTRTASSARTASARSRASHLDEPVRARRRRRRRTACSTSRPSRRRACSAATPTGAGRCGSRSTC